MFQWTLPRPEICVFTDLERGRREYLQSPTASSLQPFTCAQYEHEDEGFFFALPPPILAWTRRRASSC